jgi:tetraacyldisaccharide 4'-kinase
VNIESLWYQKVGLLQILLWPASLVFSLGVWFKNILYSFGVFKPVVISGLQVISVGNLIAGGSGKTPFVQLLATWALRANKRVAVITRGYGRQGNGLLSFDVHGLPSAAACGDEARMLARTVPGLRLYVSANRVRAAQQARADGCDVVILDDGFQHRRLHRDVDIVLDATRGNGLRIPAGPLRESVASLQRANVVVGPGHEVTVTGRVYFKDRPRFNRVVLLTGIARSERVVQSLEEQGIQVVSHFAFGDHHSFSVLEVEKVETAAKALGVEIVTTEKDAERLNRGSIEALHYRIEIASGVERLAQMLDWPLSSLDKYRLV